MDREAVIEQMVKKYREELGGKDDSELEHYRKRLAGECDIALEKQKDKLGEAIWKLLEATELPWPDVCDVLQTLQKWSPAELKELEEERDAALAHR